jgi:L-cystine transport system substrate-binding protein
LENVLKKLSSLVLLPVAMAFSLTACGQASNASNTGNTGSAAGNTAANQTSSANTSSKDLLAKVKSAGVLTIGTEGTYAPFSFHNTSNQLTGFDVEVATEVAKRMGVKPEFIETPWDGMFAGLNASRFDMIADEVGIRPDRQAKYEFSDPYITSKAVLIVKNSNTTIQSFSDVKGKKLAQSLTSNYADMAKQNGATIVADQGFNDSMQLILSGRVDGTINDKMSYLDFKKHNENAPVKIAAEDSDAAKSAFMFRKGSDTLVQEVDKDLQSMIQDGTYEKISDKWFGMNVLK